MRTLFPIAIIGFCLTFNSCSKTLPCEKNSTGSIKVENSKDLPFSTYVNDVYVGVSEPSVTTEFDDIETGTIEVIFLNNLDDTELYQATLNIGECYKSTIKI